MDGERQLNRFYLQAAVVALLLVLAAAAVTYGWVR